MTTTETGKENVAGIMTGGEGGIRTHVPGKPDHLISSQRRYGHFGTSPWLQINNESTGILPVFSWIESSDETANELGAC